MGKTTTPTKPICFISHKSDDCEKATLFKNFLNENTNMKEYTIILTCEEEGSLGIMESIAGTTLSKAVDSSIFISLISTKYLLSNYCVAELGIGLGKKFIKIENFKLGIFLLNDVERSDVELTLGKNIPFLTEITKNNITNDLGLEPKDAGTFSQKLTKFIENFENLIENENPETNRATNDVVSFIERTFQNNHTLNKRPAIIYVYRKIYEKIAMELSKNTDNLIWSAYGSPLSKTEVDPSTYLTDYDYNFSMLKGKRKRLIIFKDDKEYKTFESDKSDRKNKFVESHNKHNSQLLITTRDKIIDAFNNQNNTTSIVKYEETETGDDMIDKLHYEFAYAKKFNVILFSEFSNFDSDNGLDKEEHSLVFINIDGDKGDDFISKKINLSMHLNKFIVNNIISLTQTTAAKNRPFEPI